MMPYVVYVDTLIDYTEEEIKRFERRYENNYDLTNDERYNQWKLQFHPDGECDV